MTILWTMAGILIGHVFIEMLASAVKARIGWFFNIAAGFIGGLTAYTIVS